MDKLGDAFSKMTVAGNKEGREEKRKQKHSNFLLTINPNIYPASRAAAKELTKKLQDELRDMFSDHDKIKELVQVIGGEGEEYSGKFIDDIDVQYTVERGTHPKGRRVHAHVNIKVDHTTKVRLNLKHVRQRIKERFGVNPYVNVRVARGDRRNIEDYLKKAPELSSSDSE